MPCPFDPAHGRTADSASVIHVDDCQCAMASFSGALQLSDLDDFITPSQVNFIGRSIHLLLVLILIPWGNTLPGNSALAS